MAGIFLRNSFKLPALETIGFHSRFLSQFSTGEDVKKVVVIGGGAMGSGIATIAATNDFNVVVVDQEDEYIQKCMVMVRRTLDRITKSKFPSEPRSAKKFVEDTLSNISASYSLSDAVKDADLVIEAIHENLESKVELFKTIDTLSPSHTVFVSNTTSLPISKLAEATKRPDRVGGLHFNPILQVDLVEVIRSPAMSEDTFKKIINFSKNIGKYPAVCKDTPGFIVNRLLIPMLLDAIRLLEQHVATLEDIDFAVREGAGMDLGPFQIADQLGLDYVLQAALRLNEQFPDELYFKPPKLLSTMVSKGMLGWKSEHGFYNYRSKSRRSTR